MGWSSGSGRMGESGGGAAFVEALSWREDWRKRKSVDWNCLECGDSLIAGTVRFFVEYLI